jgi:uncharacterized protein YcbX
MKITEVGFLQHYAEFANELTLLQLFVYPVKGLRGIPLQRAFIGPQGVKHDRRIMLMQVTKSGELKKIQLSSHPEGALFEQELVDDHAVIRYHIPEQPLVPHHKLQDVTLEVPLEPEISSLEKIDVDLHKSPATGYRMGSKYDDWFSACFGFKTVVVFLGDGKRKVLGPTMGPPPRVKQRNQGWLSYLSSYLPGAQEEEEAWLTFADCAPLLITAESSLRNVRGRNPEFAALPMYKFRPNIVVDGEDEFAEDFWGELALGDRATVLLTANCGRCSSLNVDYETGKTATGALGTVLKTLMRDRRVDPGNKYSPVFGRYGFPMVAEEVEVSVGDDIMVSSRLTERCVWSWPGLY